MFKILNIVWEAFVTLLKTTKMLFFPIALCFSFPNGSVPRPVSGTEGGGQGSEHWWSRTGVGTRVGWVEHLCRSGSLACEVPAQQGKEGAAVEGQVSRGVWSECEGVPAGVRGVGEIGYCINFEVGELKGLRSTEPTHLRSY